MRVVLFTGKGGVGKTTSAAATAVRCARSGAKTLVLSTDPAHSLADALGVPLGADPAEVEGGLYAMQIDAQRRFEQSWDQIRGYLMTFLTRGGLGEVEAEELVVLPGAEEILALLEVRAQAASGSYDAIVVDCAPTAETLRLLALPEALRWYFERLYPSHRKLANTFRPLLGRAAAGYLPGDDVLAAIEVLYTQLASVQELLTDPATTSVRLVLTPESVVLAEARRTFTSLALYGFAVDGVVANRIIPGGGDDPWRSSWAAAQSVQLAAAHESFAGLPVYEVPYLPAEPVGADALAEVAGLMYGEGDPLAVRPSGPLLAVERDAGGYELGIALPLAGKGEVTLARSADDLVVTVGGHRRLVALPESLRRCSVAGAELSEGRLAVRFTDDPAGAPDAS
ncbi:MAG: ArsA family ATPase [Actinomycetia bacterium]|nr:ArsA family ATPase [Actinomycetes bacterium]